MLDGGCRGSRDAFLLPSSAPSFGNIHVSLPTVFTVSFFFSSPPRLEIRRILPRCLYSPSISSTLSSFDVVVIVMPPCARCVDLVDHTWRAKPSLLTLGRELSRENLGNSLRTDNNVTRPFLETPAGATRSPAHFFTPRTLFRGLDSHFATIK